MSDLRTPEGFYAQIRHLPYLFQEYGLRGPVAGRTKVELVEKAGRQRGRRKQVHLFSNNFLEIYGVGHV